MFANSGYFIPDGTSLSGNYATTAKSDATNSSSVGELVIDTIDDEGNSVESWTLNNAFVKSMKFGDLSYDSDDLLEVTVEFRYDWASLTDDGGLSLFDQESTKTTGGILPS